MAIWQFEVALLPANTEELVRTNRGFEFAPLPERGVTLIRPLLTLAMGLPYMEQDGMVSFGSLEGNRIHLIQSGTAGHEIWMGIDARSDADAFCTLICATAQALDCELFSPEFEVRVPAERRTLVQLLMNSRAWMYALDPSLFRETAHGWMHI